MSTAAQQAALWFTTSPEHRGEVPEWMSFHFFSEARRCPLSVTLKGSYYPSIWERKGYPQRLNHGAAAGVLVHSAADKIMRWLSEAGAYSLMDPLSMETLRSKGGFTKILSDELEEYLTGEMSNPRFTPRRAQFERILKMRLPQMRASLQELLASHRWSSFRKGDSPSVQVSSKVPANGNKAALAVGTHVEVELYDLESRWRGRLDLISVTELGCEITDFKTGGPTDDHADQMRVYGMLWDHDKVANPSALPVLNMNLIYTSGSKPVRILSKDETQSFRTRLVSETKELRKILSSETVPARPSLEVCRYCQVKLLCDSFWTQGQAFENGSRSVSAEVLLLEKRGDRSWLASVRQSAAFASGEQIILRTSEDVPGFWQACAEGAILRFTDSDQMESEPGDISKVHLHSFSEGLFILTPEQS